MSTSSSVPNPTPLHRGFRLIGMDQPSDIDLPVNMILWGKSGCGKTSYAASAPPNILYLQFDRGGHASLGGRADCFVLDMSGADPSVCDDFVGDNPMLLRDIIIKNGIKTIVFDSLTTYYWMALNNVVNKLKGGKNSISLETPSQAGYGQRNIVVLRSLTSVMLLADKMGLGVIIILHEGPQQTEQVKQGDKFIEIPGDITPSITMTMVGQVGVRMSEIWHMTQLDDGSRRVELRPGRHYTPMKSRMFDTSFGQPSDFVVRYNPITNQGVGITTLIDTWRKAAGRKIALPK